MASGEEEWGVVVVGGHALGGGEEVALELCRRLRLVGYATFLLPISRTNGSSSAKEAMALLAENVNLLRAAIDAQRPLVRKLLLVGYSYGAAVARKLLYDDRNELDLNAFVAVSPPLSAPNLARRQSPRFFLAEHVYI